MGTNEILAKRLNTLGNVKDNRAVKDIYPMLFNDAIWYQAYQNIYSNRGAFTKGINSDTLDGFDKNRISKLINSLKDKSYQPTPVRRVLIPKSNGKTRPLGIPTGTDKLVQEACRIILEAIYEPKFSNLSHGFRPNRSCHSALKEIYTWTGTKWWIEFDIKGYFDNINHNILLSKLENKIIDKRFISLINKFLKAGYIDNWKYNATYSGTPQGGIISPILANIYLNDFDKYIENKCNIINSTENERKYRKEYTKLQNDLTHARRDIPKIKKNIQNIKSYIKNNINNIAENDSEIWNVFEKSFDIRSRWKGTSFVTDKVKDVFKPLVTKYGLNMSDLLKTSRYKEWLDRYEKCSNIIETYPKIIRNTKATDTSTGLTRLHYVRYADDFVLGFIGTKEQANEIYNDIKLYIHDNLSLEISEEKSGIVGKSKGIEFLGYSVSMPEYTTETVTVKTITTFRNKRRYTGKPVFKVPTHKAVEFVKKHKYGSYVDNTSTHKTFLMNFDELEIIKQYNSELRGLINYYKYAVNCKDIIGKVQWLAHYSLAKTLAGKHKCSVAQLFKNKIIKVKKHQQTGKTWYFEVAGKSIDVFAIKNVDYTNIYEFKNDKCVDSMVSTKISPRNSAIKKLINDTCEVCGKTSVEVTIHQHHVNPVRNIPGIDTPWDKLNKMRQRKTIAVCIDCHNKIHHG